MAKKLEAAKVTNKIAEQLVLNTMNKLQGPDILKKLQEKGAVKEEKKSDAPRITDEDMTKNATDAAARGAALLDARVPGWAKPGLTVKSDTDPVLKLDMFLVQLGVLPALNDEKTRDENVKVYNAFLKVRKGETKFETGFSTDMRERLADVFIASLTGVPIARQEYSKDAVIGDGEIDFAYHGFSTEYSVIGLGQRSGYRPTVADLDREGFCIEKAGRALAAAWNAEIARRNSN